MKPIVVLSGDDNKGWQSFEEALARAGYPRTYGPFRDVPDPQKPGAVRRYSEMVCFYNCGRRALVDTAKFCATHNIPLIVFTGGMLDLQHLDGFNLAKPGFPLIFLSALAGTGTDPGTRLVNAILFVTPKINSLGNKIYRPEAIPTA